MLHRQWLHRRIAAAAEAAAQPFPTAAFALASATRPVAATQPSSSTDAAAPAAEPATSVHPRLPGLWQPAWPGARWHARSLQSDEPGNANVSAVLQRLSELLLFDGWLLGRLRAALAALVAAALALAAAESKAAAAGRSRPALAAAAFPVATVVRNRPMLGGGGRRRHGVQLRRPTNQRLSEPGLVRPTGLCRVRHRVPGVLRRELRRPALAARTTARPTRAAAAPSLTAAAPSLTAAAVAAGRMQKLVSQLRET